MKKHGFLNAYSLISSKFEKKIYYTVSNCTALWVWKNYGDNKMSSVYQGLGGENQESDGAQDGFRANVSHSDTTVTGTCHCVFVLMRGTRNNPVKVYKC